MVVKKAQCNIQSIIECDHGGITIQQMLFDIKYTKELVMSLTGTYSKKFSNKDSWPLILQV